MNRFKQIAADVRENQIYRDTLLAQPGEFFRAYCGHIPTLTERIHLVEHLIQLSASPEIYINDIYRVRKRRAAPFIHLDVCRHDEEPCTSWRDFQRIKNELIGPEHEGVELFPAESRLVDTANQYHIWVMADPLYRFPLGYKNRLVMDKVVVCQGNNEQSFASDNSSFAAAKGLVQNISGIRKT